LLEQAAILRREFLKRRWWQILIGIAVPLATAGVLSVFYSRLRLPFGDSGHLVAFCLGAGAMGAISVFIDILRLDGAQNLRDGAEAERWTAKKLRPLTKAGWALFSDIQLQGRNIDHALIGKRGAVAIETKWTTDALRIEASGLVKVDLSGRERPIDWPLEHASRHARDLRLLLRAGGIRTVVVPVVVFWGPRLTRIEGGARWIKGVLVANGAQARDWLDSLSAEPLSEQDRAQAIQCLRARQQGEWVRAGSRRAKTKDEAQHALADQLPLA